MLIDSAEFLSDGDFLQASSEISGAFPRPVEKYLRSSPALEAELRMLDRIEPVASTKCLQIGGRGVVGMALIAGGADSIVVISPMIEELLYDSALARHVRVGNRATFVCEIAEALPFYDRNFERVIRRHSLHHTILSPALAEIERALADCGKFSSVDGLKASAYSLGAKLFGKMTPGVNCRPLDRERLDKVKLSDMKLTESSHGALFRYPLAVAQRHNFRLGPRWSEVLCKIEDQIADRLSIVREQRSLVALLGQKEGA